jgi:hypothetical protein
MKSIFKQKKKPSDISISFTSIYTYVKYSVNVYREQWCLLGKVSYVDICSIGFHQ